MWRRNVGCERVFSNLWLNLLWQLAEIRQIIALGWGIRSVARALSMSIHFQTGGSGPESYEDSGFATIEPRLVTRDGRRVARGNSGVFGGRT